jgi:hypothetical protein
MRKLAGLLMLLSCTTALAGCTPARIVAHDGPQVTYAWNAQETRIARVYELAVSYCDPWRAPPQLLEDHTDGDEHRTTFVCRARGTLPFEDVF